MATTTDGITIGTFFHGALEGVHGYDTITTTWAWVLTCDKTERIAGAERVATCHRAELTPSNDGNNHGEEHGQHGGWLAPCLKIFFLTLHGGVETI
jgi:hypothetical protein